MADVNDLFIPKPHRVTRCPTCIIGSLSNDKSVVTSEHGFAYRVRVCEQCGAKVRTKQPPEEIVCVESENCVPQPTISANAE